MVVRTDRRRKTRDPNPGNLDNSFLLHVLLFFGWIFPTSSIFYYFCNVLLFCYFPVAPQPATTSTPRTSNYKENEKKTKKKESRTTPETLSVVACSQAFLFLYIPWPGNKKPVIRHRDARKLMERQQKQTNPIKQKRTTVSGNYFPFLGVQGDWWGPRTDKI